MTGSGFTLYGIAVDPDLGRFRLRADRVEFVSDATGTRVVASEWKAETWPNTPRGGELARRRSAALNAATVLA